MWFRLSDEILEEPVTIEEARSQVRLSEGEDDFDANLLMLIQSARAYCEAYCNAAFAAHRMAWSCESFRDLDRLPMGPALNIESVTYRDAAGEQQTLDAASYELRPDGLEPRIALRRPYAWPTIEPGSRITLTGRFGDNCPPDVKNAMLLMIEEGFDTLEAKAQLAMSRVDALLANHRRGAW